MKKYLYILVAGILAGFFITIGAAVYLSMLAGGAGDYQAKIIGSLFFGIGLFSVILWETWLYTGKVGLTLDNKPKYFLDLLVCLIGNVIGCIILASFISLTRVGDTLKAQAEILVQAKQNDTWYSILILSIMCGVMIYIGVKGYAICPHPVGKVVICFLAVSVFILCGFEHVVANAAYYTFAKVFDWKALLYFVIMAIGNGIGSIVLDGLLKLQKKLKD